MAAKTVRLLAPVTLCFLILGAQGTEATSVAVIFHGVVKCRNNSSNVVSNATLQVVINGTTVVATGQEASKGRRFLITVNVTSDQQLISLVNHSSIKVVSTAPLNVCGASANAVVKLDDAPIALAGYRFLGEVSKAELPDFIHAISCHDCGQQNIAADSTDGALNGHASIIIDMAPGRDIVHERVFVYFFAVAVLTR
ncbi:unnamed protein product [Urochloa humidicola]